VTDKTELVSECRFSTERLRVENWNGAPRDGGGRAALLAALADLLSPPVTKHLPEPMRLAEGPGAVEAWVAARDAESDVFCVCDRKTQALLGLLILGADQDAAGALTIRLGFLLAESAWGQGYATELVHGLVAWCKNQALTGQLLGGVETENAASAAVLTKAGFTRDAALSTGEADLFRLVL
jgi:RimJ/RimL family protein N-acetyltransferase